jgi:peptidoglycan/LPS O-acetylase OafA/YrhL
MAGLVACVFAGHSLLISQEEDSWGNALYLAFNRQSWAVALSGVILLCIAGYGGPVDVFLSLPVFQFLTKLSYSMYLVHVSVIVVRHAAMKNTFKFSDIAVVSIINCVFVNGIERLFSRCTVFGVTSYLLWLWL